ncbi:MAG: ImmA/IrrE family metallo-endopeptidase [Thermoanaerobacterium sp.]|nr:ImmA/IrrE family metallo-endopeptidase [Thermoanaerobacterium sp.]
MPINKIPGTFARELLNDLSLKPPIDVISICNNFNITIETDDIKDSEALFIIHNGIKKIILNQNIDYKPRKNFTIAHEIGHFYLPWHENKIYDCKFSDIQSFHSNILQETEANQFAAELLIPTEFLINDINNKEINLSLIKILSKKYETSLASMGIKIIENTYEPVAIVVTENGKIKWSSKSKYFFKKILSNGLSVKEQSLAFDFYKSRDVYEQSDSVYSIAWLEDGSMEEYIKEESLPMPNLNMVFTLLTLIADENKYIEEEYY